LIKYKITKENTALIYDHIELAPYPLFPKTLKLERGGRGLAF